MKDNILNIENCKKIAVMGGTFDPIHYGHLAVAVAVRDEFETDRVIFIPAGKPPHKKNINLANNEHRYIMSVLAISSNPYFDVSRIELDRDGITYTVDTITELKQCCDKDAEIFFIIGADAINEIFSWKDFRRLLGICSFVAVTRPGYKKTKLRKMISEINEKFDSKIYPLEVPALAISSSQIRDKIKTNSSIKYLVPDDVEAYIKKYSLYKYDEANTEQISCKLKKILTRNRFIHTQGVAKEAVRLARHYNSDTYKAYTAGLLHDCAKDYSAEEKRRLCASYKIKIDDIIEKQIDLVHSFLGAALCKKEYGIKDKDIINAVKYHTTGRADMSELEKIIYLADCIEPNRKQHDGLEKTRHLAYTDLNLAMKYNLELTIKHNENKGRMIHPLSIEALNYFKNLTEEDN